MTVNIRLAGETDAEGVAAIYRPIVETTAISFETSPPDRDEIARRIADTTRTHPWLVCEVDGRVGGYAYASGYRRRGAYRWSVETSVYVHEGFRGRGVGRGLYESLFAILAAQGFFNAYAGIALPNPASVGLHESIGFEKIGVYRRVGYKLGQWHDVGWWQLTLAPHDPSPRQPSDLAAVSALPDWERLVMRGQSSVRAGIAPAHSSSSTRP